MTPNELHNLLKDQKYVSNRRIDFAATATANDKVPLLIEGAPGTGKTALAKAMADALGLPLLRVQMYEGVDASHVLYDYDYQKQLLSIEAIKSSLNEQLTGKNPNEALKLVEHIDFYDEHFLIKRPVLKAITGDEQVVLLIDEIDKAPEELEYALLEVLENYSMSIPQYGTITCPADKKPLVFITSNNTRELSEAFKRRCNYLYITPKNKNEMVEIMKEKTTADPILQETVATLLVGLATANNLKQAPSLAEGVSWLNYISENATTQEELVDSLTFLAKHKNDLDIIKRNKAFKDLLAQF